ncbi:DUF3769 domain-containing protein [Cyanobium sp. Cruz-8H5]|uniref:DUF3769 domain-containing protein n=1 Tax=Cyanobium sp. Cruz-8H5 TaxID=2823712 RepID=UPI0020CDB88B|nr:DUF3769 domain-containing protein [Cyanobium sp. Cruz-8H5]MCP9859498.1 DUF3769 domain-containing protein [Cyanobium sp. Cruz-8H5]MCP9866560.1 DUF3769 domain-containing protein [Cyanobium sp. Cruz-8D1]
MVLHPSSGRRQAPEGLTPGLGLWIGLCGVLALTASPARARPELPSRLQAAQAQLAPAAPPTANPFDDEPQAEPHVQSQPEPPAEPAGPVQPLPAAATAPAPGVDPAPTGDAVPLELELTANQQGYDSQLQRFVATGSVMARLAGGRLLADRLEFEASTRTLLAVGNVRFQRGQQYLQGSRLRYALLEGVGEIDDVYGVIDLDSTQEDFDLEQAASTPLPPPEPISCTPSYPAVPQWQPYPWAVTTWAGQMYAGEFGDTFTFSGRFRPEYLGGIGMQRRLFQAGPLSLEFDANLLGHKANSQPGGGFNQLFPFSDTPAQNFGEFTGGIGLRLWLRPWLNVFFVEGLSVTTAKSNYEQTFRENSARLLNYLAFEVEALVTPRWSAVGRIHHRSGAYGTFSGVSEGSNAYLLGLRYRFGTDNIASQPLPVPPAQGCPGAPPLASEPPDGLAQQLEQVTMGPGWTGTSGQPAPPPPQAAPPAQGGVWRNAREQERRRREAIARIPQRVENVTFERSLKAERRFGFPREFTTPDTANDFGTTRPEQLKDQTTTGNQELIKGTVSRWRLQARRLKFTPNTLSGDRVGFTNDPFTPAQSWMDSEQVVITLLPNGDTLVKARRNTLRLEDRLPVRVVRERRIEKEEEVSNPLVIGNDREDRDGFFLGYNIPVKIGEKGLLNLQPQVMIQRLYTGNTDAYPLPGSPAGSTNIVEQPAEGGDYFGLDARLTGPLLGFNADARLSLSTLNPDNIANGTRSFGDLARVLNVPLLGTSTFRLFGAYRFRTWNGSLGEQDVYSAYGVSLEQQGNLPSWGQLSRSYYWRMGVGNFQAVQTNDIDLLQVWRANGIGSFNVSYPIWTGKPTTSPPVISLANSPVPIVPGLRFNANLLGVAAYFSDGTNQNTVGLSGGPTLTLGRFEKPFLDYTQLTVTGGITLRQGQSPLNFDRAVDLGTIGIGLSQQLVGPLVFSGGIGFNVDPSSGFYGDVTGSYVELRWQRRSYEVGVYYSPYDGLGGIRVRLNDFNFKGPGTPFIPYHPTQGALQRPF